MSNRRSFLEKFGKGAALSTLALTMPSTLFSHMNFGKIPKMKNKIIGIIGAENSHTRGFGKMFNLDKKFPGWEVKYVWGEKEEFALQAKTEAGIPNIVQDPAEMMGKIDALIVDHRHGDLHLDAALPFVKAGIPTFIDKPFCYSNSIYGGFFFYGVHMVEPLIYLFDEKIVSARFNKNDRENLNSSASLVFENGRMATLVITTKKYGWQTFVETEEGVVELKSRVETKGPDKNYVDMVTMFSTGTEPRSHESIIHGIAVLEAIQKSIISGNWESVIL